MGKSLANFSIDIPHPGIGTLAFVSYRVVSKPLKSFTSILRIGSGLESCNCRTNTPPRSLLIFVARTRYCSAGNYRRGLKFLTGIRKPQVVDRLSAGENQRKFSNRQPYSSSDSFKSH